MQNTLFQTPTSATADLITILYSSLGTTHDIALLISDKPHFTAADKEFFTEATAVLAEMLGKLDKIRP